MSVILPKYLEEVIKVLPKPKNVWKYLLAVTQIPRGSNIDDERFRHQKILSFLKEQAEKLNCETYVDSGENLIVRKAAYPGYEKKPVVCLQCHMDMVCEKNDDIDINFETDPLIPRIDGSYIKATGTSLGADNGIGIAACFAMLEDANVKHGPLEILVTRDEETGMFGAQELESGILKAKYMINVDSEEENAVCIGCSGGFTIDMMLHTPRKAIANYVTKTVTLNNFCGGHSGVDINLGRANPLHVMGRLLKANNCEYRIVNVICGTADNAIPRKCVLEVAVPELDLMKFESNLRNEFDLFVKEYHVIETSATLTIAPAVSDLNPMTSNATSKFVNFLNVYPFAVQRYIPGTKEEVETSTTCAIAKSDDDGVHFVASIRSSCNTQLDMMYHKIQCICDMAGIDLSEKKATYPGWEPNIDSPLTKSVVSAYEKAVGKSPRVYAIHAGLECGILMEKYPDLDCTSIGPEINYPHSPEERLLIDSVPRFYDVLSMALEKLAL